MTLLELVDRVNEGIASAKPGERPSFVLFLDGHLIGRVPGPVRGLTGKVVGHTKPGVEPKRSAVRFWVDDARRVLLRHGMVEVTRVRVEPGQNMQQPSESSSTSLPNES